MAKSKRTTRTLIFKRAKFEGVPSNVTLQKLLSKSIKALDVALDRGEPSEDSAEDDEGISTRLINFHKDYRKMLFCEVFDFTKGQVMATAKVDRTAKVFDLDAIAPDDKSEFISGVLYFGVLGDLVVISQSKSIQSRGLETHLNWLFQKALQLGDGQWLRLVDEVPPKAKNMGNANSITFDSPVNFTPNDGGEITTKPEVPGDTVKNVSFKMSGVAVDTIRALFPKGLKLPTDLNPEQLALGKELKVELKLSWKGARKNDSTDVLDVITNQLRHVDDDVDWKVNTSAGEITRDEIKLRTKAPGVLKENGLLNRKEFWPHMAEWLQELLSTGRVKPND